MFQRKSTEGKREKNRERWGRGRDRGKRERERDRDGKRKREKETDINRKHTVSPDSLVQEERPQSPTANRKGLCCD